LPVEKNQFQPKMRSPHFAMRKVFCPLLFLAAALTGHAPDGTPGLPDRVAPVNPLRFGEVHFAAGNSVDWIELQNTSSAPASTVDLSVASLPDGSNKVPLRGDVPAAGYGSWTVDFSLDPTGNVTLYRIPVTVYGDWSDSLGNKGDLIRLTDSAGNLADEVDYHTGGDWPVIRRLLPTVACSWITSAARD
jgi:hypothetical protein